MTDAEPRPRRLTTTTAALLIAFASLLVTIVTGGVAIRASNAADKAQEATDLVVVQRTEARKNTCEKDLKFALAHNKFVNDDADGDLAFVVTLITAGGTRTPTPETQTLAEAEFEKIEKQRTENLVAVPDCSPEGIRLFYEGDKP